MLGGGRLGVGGGGREAETDGQTKTDQGKRHKLLRPNCSMTFLGSGLWSV